MNEMEEMNKLAAYLKEHGYNYSRCKRSTETQEIVLKQMYPDATWGEQIIVYSEDGMRLWDAICGYGSYGYEQGLLEIMGDTVVRPCDGDTVAGYLTASDIIYRLEHKEYGYEKTSGQAE